ncbi:hypothetical protein [Raineyella sp. LH-20]|uniref:hypothetical protein n=1 Tax=Raineyella sp. LH-20 TaxID=3081204 RepID=UPI00295531A9|nr:hypothetical protein [Raineyella sp. LH-20]WOP19834.1 hypothetical protein R0146_06060 [Raineyella sp. LH-20]
MPSIRRTLVLGLVLGPPGRLGRRWRAALVGAVIVGAVIVVVALDFVYIYPVLTDRLMLYQDWLSRLWLRSWA